ncbi:MAG: RhuM family protein [Polaribacter sp.]|nr:RhuM family protein [Polaribacter sp.]
MDNEIILYRPGNKSLHLEVRLEEETVWLTQNQMVELFTSTKQNISLHINNIYKEGELEFDLTVKENLTVRLEGKRKVNRKLRFYNLDVIISVGYRVKSQRGTQFRIWANRVLKDYLLKGYVLNKRVDRIESKLIEHDQKFEMFIKTNLKPTEGIFYDDQMFDAYQFASDVIKSAKRSIILIDNYIDESVLMMLSKREKDCSASIYTQTINKELKLDIAKHNTQYPSIDIHKFTKSHDRFLIIDGTIVYHIGASLKDLGKRWFAFSKIKLDVQELMKKLKNG